jgi:alcohol dehydrogenase
MRLDPLQVFNFLPLPTDVHFGSGVVATLPDRVRAAGGSRVLIVTDPGVRRAGLIDQAIAGLSAAALPFDVFDEVTADSGSALIVRGVDAVKTSHADVVVGVGGGSALDTAKAVAALATNPGDPLDYVGVNRITARGLPCVAVPTTSGTGSEVSLWSVFTDDARKLKVAIGGVMMYPAAALCDPDLTMELPPSLTASTGMDALAHAIECCTNNACQPISGALALEAVALIGGSLRQATLNGRDRRARYAMMLASTMAGMAMNPTRLGLAHALAMPLGSWELKIPHSLAIAVTLPLVMEFNWPAAPERFAAVARALGEPVDGCSVADAASRAPAAVRRLADAVGIPRSLRDCGLREEHVDRVVDEAMKSGNVTVNPRRTSRDDLAGVLRRTLQEENGECRRTAT